jgi:pilus assembly protein CpaF
MTDASFIPLHQIKTIAKQNELPIMTHDEIFQQSTTYFLRPVASLLNDESVTEILINGTSEIYFERAGQLYRHDQTYESEEFLMSAAVNIAEFVDRPLDDDHPHVDARLPDGSRVHIIIPPLSRVGICISIRKFSKRRFNLEELVEKKSLTKEAKEYLEIAVLLKKNIAISGGTGTGKTSLLNALSSCIPDTERIVVIEDSSELKLHQPHTVYLEAQPARPGGRGAISIRELFANSLRMRPDRVVVGEVRRGEALDMLQAMIAGHAGSITTVHASSPRAALTRLEMLSMQNEVSLTTDVAKMQVAAAIDLVIQIQRDGNGFRRVQEITEIHEDLENGKYVVSDIFRLFPKSEGENRHIELAHTGKKSIMTDELEMKNLRSIVKTTSSIFQR